MDGRHSSSHIQILQYMYQSFVNSTERANYYWYHRHFHVSQIFSSLARSRYLSFYSLLSVSPCCSRNGKVHFFLLTITRSGRLAEIWWSVCILKSQRSLCISFSRKDSGLCIHHLFVWSNFNFLYNFQCITLPTQSCLVLYSLCTIIIIIIIYSLRIFHISVCWWSFTGVWVTATHLKFPGLFPVFWPISIM